MPALGSIFATKAGDKAGKGDRPGHMTSPVMTIEGFDKTRCHFP